MKSLVVFCVCIIGMVSGCKEVVHFNTQGQARALVLNSILQANIDSIRIELTQTRSPDEGTRWKIFPNAEIQIYEDGQQLGNAEWNKEGYFLYHHRLLPGHTYRIIAHVPEYGTAWGETTIPEQLKLCELKLKAGKDGPQKIYFASCHWQDTPGKRNFYWLGAQYSAWREGLPWNMEDTVNLKDVSFFVTKSTLPDPFNRVFNEGSNPEYEYYMRVEDSGLDGHILDMSYRIYNSHAMKARIYMLNTDHHYDAYLKSIIENYNNSVSIDEFPLLYHPAYVHTNVHGGVGLVASYISYDKILNLPAQNENMDVNSPAVGRQ